MATDIALKKKATQFLPQKQPHITGFFDKYPTTLIEASGEAVLYQPVKWVIVKSGIWILEPGRIVYQSHLY